MADEEVEEKKGKKSSKEKPAASGKKDPVTYVSDSGEGCLVKKTMPFQVYKYLDTEKVSVILAVYPSCYHPNQANRVGVTALLICALQPSSIIVCLFTH